MADSAEKPRGIRGLRNLARRRSELGREARKEREVIRQEEKEAGSRHPDSIVAHLSLNPLWFGLAVLALVTILLLPGGEDLSVTGQRALAILAFAVILWVTEAVSYPVSAVLIVCLTTLLMGFSPDAEQPGDILGTNAGLSMALGGFASSAVALVAAALALAAAMQATGLHRRVALVVMKFAGESVRNIVIGAIIISIVLAFFVPSATARAGAVVPILIGMIAAFGVAKNSRLGALLIITAANAVSIWNVGIQTAAAQNLIAIDFIRDTMGVTVTWPQWFIWAAPWSLVMSVVLYFVVRWAIKPETDKLTGGRETVRQELAELGPMTAKEVRLTVVAVLLLTLWATQGVLHPIDAATVTLIAIGLLLMPKIGVFSWKAAEKLINWGTLVVFAVGISLGTLLLTTGAAEWLSERTFTALGIQNMPLLATIAVVAAFNILIHLGFASATALASALIPVFIAVAASLPNTDEVGIGFVIIQQFVISFGFLLPISAPQNMLAYGTGAFTIKQFIKVGIPLTIAGYLLVLLFSATYWQWIGLL